MILKFPKFSIIAISTLSAGSQRRYFSLVGFFLLFSLGPLLKVVLNIQSIGVVYIFYFGAFFVRLLMLEHKRLNLRILFYILVALVFLTLQNLSTGQSIDEFILGVSKFIFLPILALYAVKDLQRNKVDLFSIFIIYLIINYFVFYVRAFYDYSFFGVLDADFEEWTYRPSNLSTPIIFAIEIAILISLMLRSNLSIAYKIMIAIITVLPLALMHSRSSYIIIAVSFFFFLLHQRRYGVFLSFVSILFFITLFISTKSGEIPYFLTIFDFSSDSYGTRFSSMEAAISVIASMDISELLLGLGSGTASQHSAGASLEVDVVYVENALISLIVENGIIIFFCFFLSLVYYPIRTGLKGNSAHLFVILVSIWLVNFFAASLTVLSVQLLYWTVYFYGLFQRHQ